MIFRHVRFFRGLFGVRLDAFFVLRLLPVVFFFAVFLATFFFTVFLPAVFGSRKRSECGLRMGKLFRGRC